MNINPDMNFLALLQTFRRGSLAEDADVKLSELIEAIANTSGSGKLVLTLPFSVNKAGQIECSPSVKITKPVRSLGTGIYYATEDSRLTRRDPNQIDIEDEIFRRREEADGTDD